MKGQKDSSNSSEPDHATKEGEFLKATPSSLVAEAVSLAYEPPFKGLLVQHCHYRVD